MCIRDRNELLEICGGDREIIVARELTKKFEEHAGNNINKVIEFFRDKTIKRFSRMAIFTRG